MTVIGFPGEKPPELTAQEKQVRVLTEVKRLAGLAPADRQYQVRHVRAALFGLRPAELEKLVEAEVKEREKAARKLELEDRRREQRAARMEDKKESARLKEKADKEKREQAAIEKAAKQKVKEKSKALAQIAQLPSSQHETKLVELATKLDLDLPELREDSLSSSKRGAAAKHHRATGTLSRGRSR
jgi:hypothetical protein